MRTRKNYLLSGDISEQAIQKTVIAWVRLQNDIEPYVMHFPNEGKRSIQYGRLLRALGLRPGVSDLFIALPRHHYHGAWIELKSAKGRVSPEQKRFLEDMHRQGYATCVHRSIPSCIDFIQWYCYSDKPLNQQAPYHL